MEAENRDQGIQTEKEDPSEPPAAQKDLNALKAKHAEEMQLLKAQYEQKVDEARKEIEYDGSNNEADEDRIGLLLKNGTHILKIKSLNRQLASQAKELDARDKQIKELRGSKGKI